MDSAKYRQGISLFNGGHFYDAHEVLEDVWREAHGAEKNFLQAIIQIAVGLHHYSTGNLTGAGSLLARGGKKLAEYPETYGGIEVGSLRGAVQVWVDVLARGQAAPPPPRLEPAGHDVRISLPVSQSTAKRPPAAAVEEVPLLDLRRQYAQIREQVHDAVERVCSSQQFILGEEVAALEREVAEFTGTQHAVGCASGTDALWLALAAGGVTPGDEVITSGFSFFASASAIVRAGARPVLMDVDPATLNLDPALVERRLNTWHTARLRAILPVHLYGQCADMDAFQRLAAERNLLIIEDAAQAFGAAWRGRRAGSLGTAAAFSFYPTKNLSAYGDGGGLTTSDPALAERARLLARHGSRERYYHQEMGANSRLDALQAAILRVKMKHVEEWNEQRRQRAAVYDCRFAEAGLLSGSEPPVRLLRTQAQAYHVFHQYVVRAARRDELRQFLSRRRIGTEVYYPLPLHLQRAFCYLGYGPGDLPESERAANEVLALPMFPELREDEQQHVVQTIAGFYS